MRIDHLERSKHKAGRILVFTEDGACLKITEQELLDFGLRAGDEVDDRTLQRLQEASQISDVKGRAAELIGRRAMSRRDLEKKLMDKGASPEAAQEAGDWLESIGALNDGEYAGLLIRHYSQMGYGPARLREKLYEKGVPRELWEEAMEQAPACEDKIDSFLEKKLLDRLPDEREKKRLTDALLRRGFSWGQIKAAWERRGAETWEE